MYSLFDKYVFVIQDHKVMVTWSRLQGGQFWCQYESLWTEEYVIPNMNTVHGIDRKLQTSIALWTDIHTCRQIDKQNNMPPIIENTTILHYDTCVSKSLVCGSQTSPVTNVVHHNLSCTKTYWWSIWPPDAKIRISFWQCKKTVTKTSFKKQQ